MKNLLVYLLMISFHFSLYSQVPEGIKYQAIARNKTGNELVSQSISLRFSILINSPTGKAVYIETQNTTTNQYGLFSIDIGMGTVDSGNFSQINWAKGSYFIKVEMDASGGTNYAFMGVSPVLSVPYALHSKTADRALNDKDTIPQALKFSNDTLYLTNGGMVYLGGYSDKKDIQSLKSKLKGDSLNFVTNLSNEIINRQKGDSILNVAIVRNTTNLTNETNSRIAGDNNQKTKEISDSSYLKGLINSNTTNLTNETNNRITSDNNLKAKVVSDSTYLKGLISTETTNRTNSYNTLQTNITNTKTKESSDSSLFAGYLNTVNTTLTTETNSRVTGDNNLKAKIVSDSSYLRGMINTTNTNLTNETNSRISGDNTLKAKVVSDSTTLRGLINTNSTNLSTETTNRTNSDNNLQTNINTQKSKEVSDSSYLKGLINTANTNISTETTNRTNGDNTLQTNINSQKSKELSDSSYLKGLINTTNTNLSTETTNRTNGDNTLQTNINTQKSKEITDSSYLKGLINTTNTNLSTETTNRTNGDNTLQTNINNQKSKEVSDSSYLKGQINTTNTNLSNEITNRINGVNNLKAKVVSDSSYLKGLIDTKQGKLTAGAGIIINSSNVIKAIDSVPQIISMRHDTIFLTNGGFAKLTAGNSPGNMQYWNGSNWVFVPTGTYGQTLVFCNGVPTWGGCISILTTNTHSNLTNLTVVSGGNISNNGGSQVITRGVCWSTSPNPTTANNITNDGSGNGSYSSNITGLSPKTKYYVRAYATNTAGTAYGNLDTFTTLSVFTLGQSYAGGIIFYLDGTKLHGLIAATFDQSSGIQWGCQGASVGAGSATNGAANTSAIVSGCSTRPIAASICDTLTLNGYTDWYLPSENELYYLYLSQNLVGGFSASFYCSSTENSANYAWFLYFVTGSGHWDYKSATAPVRAIRAF